MNHVPSLIVLSTVFIYLQQRHGSNAETTCSKNCKPFIQEKTYCKQNTGECSEGCKTGFFGLTCSKICPCGGGPCNFVDGTCLDVSTVQPVQVSQGSISETQESYKTVDPLVVSCICLLVVILILLISKDIILKMCKRKYRPQAQHGEDQPLKFNSEENHPVIHDASAMRLSEPSQKLTDSQSKFLVDKLGVHLLNPEDTEPVVLFCSLMKFDYYRVNRKTSRLKRDHILSNEPASSEKEFSVGFKKFHGTTCLSPISPTDIPTYFEVSTHVHLNKVLGSTDLLMSVGLCIESQRDQWYQIKLGDHCYTLNVGPYKDRIFTYIYKEKFPDGIKKETNLKNQAGESGYLQYGILIDRGKEAILFFDVFKMKLLGCFDKVDIKRKDFELGSLWPMFGVYSRSFAEVTMELITGRDVDMTPDKTNMILSVLRSLK